MRISNSLATEIAIRTLSRRMQQLSLTQVSIADGRAIRRPADDPEGMRRVLDLRTMLSAVEQYRQNIQQGGIAVNLMAQTLEAVDTFVSQALSLADTARQNAAAYTGLGGAVDQIRDQVLQLANTHLNGTYLFAGNQDATRPFLDDGTYRGDRAPFVVRINQHIDVSVTADGQSLFKSPEDLFDILEKLQHAMENGDADAIAAQRDALDRFREHLRTVRSRMALRQEQMTLGANFLTQLAHRLETDLGQTESVDMTRAVVDLKSQEAIYQASIQAAAQILQPSLLRFLN